MTESPDCLCQNVLQFRLRIALFRAGAPALKFVTERRVNRFVRIVERDYAPRVSAPPHGSFIKRDSHQPGVKAWLPPKRRQFSEGLDESVLHCIFGILAVAR